ncbi:MAG: hypothetical protein ABH864_01050 [archaeon]
MDKEIFKIEKDKTRAKDLLKLANERIKEIIPIFPKNKQFKIIEEYYEAIVQLMTAVMYADGYKTLGHITLIRYISINYREIPKEEIDVIDTLRKIRHGTLYYGKKAGEEFFLNHKKTVDKTITQLEEIIKNKLEEK